MEVQIGKSLGNNNYIAEPVTFIVVPHRRYTLPFVFRNIYIEEVLTEDNNGKLADHGDDDSDEFIKLLASDEQDSSAKDSLTKMLNNVFVNLMREAKTGVSKRGRVLRKRLGMQYRSKSTGYLVRDRFHLCPPCRKFKKITSELYRLRKPALQKIKKIVKSRANPKVLIRRSNDDRLGGRDKEVNNVPEVEVPEAITEEPIRNPPHPHHRAADLRHSSPSRFFSSTSCPVSKLLTRLRNDVVHLFKEKIGAADEKMKHGGDGRAPKRNSSFYLDEGIIERRTLL